MTVNRDRKTTGGTTRFSVTTNAVKQWEIDASYWASLRRVFDQHL